MTGKKDLGRREHAHPIDINSDDPGTGSSDPTLLYGGISDEHDRPDVGEDRDHGPHHHIRRPGEHNQHGSGSD